MIADMIKNKKLNSIVTELFIRCRELNISLAFINQSYFKVPKDVINNNTHIYYEDSNQERASAKRELQLQQQERASASLNYSSDTDSWQFIKIYRKSTNTPYSFLIIDNTLPSDDPLRFRNNLNI